MGTRMSAAKIASGVVVCVSCAAQSAVPATPASVAEPAPAVPTPSEEAAVAPAARGEQGRQARQELDHLRAELGRAASRLQTEGTAAQRAHFARELYDIEHDRRLLGAALLKAERAPAEEWEEAHGTLSEMVSVLGEVGRQKAAEIDRALDGEAGETPAAADAQMLAGIDLCSMLQVTGARADLRQDGQQLILELTTPSADAVLELRRRVLEQWRPPLSREDSAAPGLERAAVALEETAGGVRFVFTPASGEASDLKSELESHVGRVQAQSC